ncbi:hypothetical protein VAE151_560659 [Vibrio aestuarianus]|nr:hypothetical protein VAE055_380653 [Vibrio aestuarianus]CAH8208650.1 hypothetical protein VAE032_271299 [Vibrio aestuarianus]CAH8208721.1 hypothetical protein VAE128_461304 [Vibrio aestuarianus]CAH8208946.1 hypothetical protein VAE130_571300 [Vibrio aestuarianus]CAH8216600.1 hypothetical protein VAE142_891295 [Vibrio aestuarianus]
MSVFIKDQISHVLQSGLYRAFIYNLLFLFVIAFILYVDF